MDKKQKSKVSYASSFWADEWSNYDDDVFAESYYDDEKGECFRKYKYVQSSYEDHSKFLSGRRRYASLFKLRKSDYKGWAKGLKKAGYATDKKYPKKLIKIIEDYKLFTLLAK